MNERQLKQGLLQLKSEGWPFGYITDGFVDEFLQMKSDPPAREIRDHFIASFKTRLHSAIQAQRESTDLWSASATTKTDRNITQPQHSKIGRKQIEK